MTNVPDSAKARLAALREAIDAQKSKLELHGMFDLNHNATESDLRKRYHEVADEVAERVEDHAEVEKKVSWLEQQVAHWVASTDLDFKS